MTIDIIAWIERSMPVDIECPNVPPMRDPQPGEEAGREAKVDLGKHGLDESAQDHHREEHPDQDGQTISGCQWTVAA